MIPSPIIPSKLGVSLVILPSDGFNYLLEDLFTGYLVFPLDCQPREGKTTLGY